MTDDEFKALQPRLRKQLSCHMNGGSKWSSFTYQVLFDGEPIEMSTHTGTDGSPNYNVTTSVIEVGGRSFDVLKNDNAIREAVEFAVELGVIKP